MTFTFARACVAIEQQHLHLALLAHAVLGLALARSSAATSASVTVTWSRKRSAVSATTCSFTFSLRCLYSRSSSGVRHRHPVGERGAQLVDHHAAPQVLLELRLRHRRALAAEQLLVARLADEPAVLLQAGNREDLLRQLLVADADALALRLGQRRLLVDHLLQDLLLDAELPQQLLVDVAAVRPSGTPASA